MADKFWVTKYALSGGIFSVTKSENGARVDQQGFLHCKRAGAPSYGEVFGRTEFFASEDEAKQKQVVMRDKKIASLKKRIAALEAITA